MSKTAPYHMDVALGPKPSACEWVEAEDGKRLRVVAWKGGKKGTLMLFQGRTEYTEKYGAVVEKFLELGYSVVTCDWRGQGLSDRYPRHRQIGEVDEFSDYQLDVAVMQAFAKSKRMPKIRVALGHSLGGALLLRALQNGLDIEKAIFSSPMWGILVPALLRPLTGVIMAIYSALGIQNKLAPGRSLDNYVETADFEGNSLTTDRDEFELLIKQIKAHPDFGLGGPSVNWAYKALEETQTLADMPAPDYDCLTVYAGDEQIVDNGRIKDILSKWPMAKGVELAGAQHEVLMETPALQAKVWKEIEQFLAS